MYASIWEELYAECMAMNCLLRIGGKHNWGVVEFTEQIFFMKKLPDILKTKSLIS